jgi:hypothetical protein
LVRWARRAGTTRLLSCLGCSTVGPVQNIFSSPVHYFNLCVPIAQQPGQAVAQGRLSLNVCLRLHPTLAYTATRIPPDAALLSIYVKHGWVFSLFFILFSPIRLSQCGTLTLGVNHVDPVDYPRKGAVQSLSGNAQSYLLPF